MKKLFAFLATLSMLFAVGCNEQGVDDNPNEPIPENIFFGLDKETVSISPDGGSVDVIVYSNYKWEISGTSDWCTPSATSGKANEDGQKVSFSADVAYDNREATFWFRCADEKIKFTVSQSFKEVIIADENNTFSVPAEGGVAELNYQTTVECEVIIPEEAKSWITIAPADATRGLMAESVQLDVAENATYSARSAVVKVVKVGDNTLFAEYTINQVQNDAIIADENNIFNVPVEGGVVEVTYQTNVECKVVIPEEAKSWISLAPATRALVNESATLTVAENTTYSARSAVIKVVKVDDNTLFAEYTINQVQNDAIISDKNNIFNVPVEGGVVEVAYKTNVECEVIIPAEAKSWISLAPATRALVDESVTLNIAANNAGPERSAVVRVVAVNNSELFVEYTITQAKRYYIEYTSTDGSTVTPYNSDVFGATIIRNEYTDGKGYIDFDAPVTSIGDSAFYMCTSLTSITIPDSVTEIGDSAFADCTSLTSVTIPDSVTEIGDYAFEWCVSLPSVTIPDSVTEIGSAAFADCTSLSSITIPDSVTEIGSVAFADCTSLSSIIIPDSVTSIGTYAFDGCTSLTSITIGNGVTSIGEWTFHGCTSLTSITIGNGVTSIGEFAFLYCTSLASVTIPDSVTSIGLSAFRGCDSLTSITIGNGVTLIGNYAFYGCTGELIINSKIVEENYTKYFYPQEDGWLSGAKFTKLTIGDSVTSIGNYAFAYCDSLTSITIGNGVTSIGEWAFCECTSLTSVTIPDSVTEIGDSAFAYCYSLTSVTISDSVTSTGDYAFFKCTSLTSVTIPDSVTEIGDSAFAYCYSLTSITIPDSVTSIGKSAFDDCTSLTSITIPDSVTSIGKSAFGGCTCELIINSKIVETDYPHDNRPHDNYDNGWLMGAKFSKLTIGNGITSIGDYVFWGCHSLTSVTIPDSVTSIGVEAFSNCSSLPSITIPDSVTSIGKGAFTWCASLPSVTIPDSVTEIGDSAFSSCKSLTSVYCKPTTPPSGGRNMFSGFYTSYCRIYVPTKSVWAYKTAEYWSLYDDDIVGYDF